MGGEIPCYAHMLDDDGRMIERPEVLIQRVYPPDLPSIGKRILVDRFWPRGLSREALRLDAWFRELAPSIDLIKWFAHDPERWEEFQRRYWRELQEPDRQPQLLQLVEMARSGPVTLLFAARDAEHNQAVVLKSVLDARLLS